VNSGKGDSVTDAHWRVGIDAGGTFTDVCLFEEETGALRLAKVPSTSDNPSHAITTGLERILQDGGRQGEVAYFGHGSTVATNALIEGRGVPTGLITTAGFRDLLELGRNRRPDLYDLQVDKPEPLVRRDKRLEVRERVHFDGTVESPLDEEDVRTVVRRLRTMGVEAVAICFLYSYVRPEHEQVVQRILAEEFPEAFVSASHEVLPEFREYERLSTVVTNAYLGPVMSTYLTSLEPQLRAQGVRVPAHITQSNGGVISFEVAEREPVRTILSGPSTGVVGATYVARLAGYDNIITFDMGGTSTDVSLIERGRPRLASEMHLQGYPIKTPMLDINTIGAGGGSIAWLDSGGHLKVGPRSAGAVPGPVCYGLGNVEPTVTDASVVLQTLNPSYLLAGQMRISQGAARTAIERLATQLGLEIMATAQGILSVVTANMARAVRVISVQRGYDPRDYALVAFGGAGPLHAARLARELAMPRVIIPESPGLLCALGLLMTDLRTNYSQTRLLPADERSLSAMTETFAMLEERATAWFEQEGIEPSRRQLRRAVDMRYAGQNYELTVEAPSGAVTAQSLGQLLDGFTHAHEQMYGYVAPEEPVQVVTFRLEASGLAHKVELCAEPEKPSPPEAARSGERRAYLPEAGGWTDCPVYDRSLLRAGFQIAGPAVVEQMDSTTLVLPGQMARVDPYRNLLLEDVR